MKIAQRLVALAAVACIVLTPVSLSAHDEWPHFYVDDPVWTDRDDLKVPEPSEVELSQYYDFLENTFLGVGRGENLGAQNINTLGEVPNSSWFTNRQGFRRMTLEELVKGPKKGPGPDTENPWTIISAKTEGITPGFVIRDGRGDVYFIKIDPSAYPEMATSAEAICTPLFHAFGYNVPENYLLNVPLSMIQIGEEATVKDQYGKKRKMTENDLRTIYAKAPLREDGALRVIASKAIPGTSLGHFRYYGTRPDDGNDVIPHQYRGELRGLRVFAAWLNHDDTRSINSLDVYTEEDYVKHYLIDFGSCLGSGSVKPQTLRAGNEYMWEVGPTFKTMATLGLWVRPYLKIHYPGYPSIGRFESKAFRPELWRPEYPNPAFELMDERDAFWAAKIVMSFTDEEIRAIVENGGLSDGEAREYMIETLIERRDKIGLHYLNQVNPIGEFRLEGDVLYFENLSVKHGFGEQPNGYAASWWTFDNELRRPIRQIGNPVSANVDVASRSPNMRGASARTVGTHSIGDHLLSVRLPRGIQDSVIPRYVYVEISPTEDAPAKWRVPVRVFLRDSGAGWEIVGILR